MDAEQFDQLLAQTVRIADTLELIAEHLANAAEEAGKIPTAQASPPAAKVVAVAPGAITYLKRNVGV